MERDGFVYVRDVLSAESVKLFAAQLKAELQQTGPGAAAAPPAAQIGKKRKTEAKATLAPSSPPPHLQVKRQLQLRGLKTAQHRQSPWTTGLPGHGKGPAG